MIVTVSPGKKAATIKMRLSKMLFFLCFRPTIKFQGGFPVDPLFEPLLTPFLTRPLKNYFYRLFGVSDKFIRSRFGSFFGSFFVFFCMPVDVANYVFSFSGQFRSAGVPQSLTFPNTRDQPFLQDLFCSLAIGSKARPKHDRDHLFGHFST